MNYAKQNLDLQQNYFLYVLLKTVSLQINRLFF